MSEVLRVQSTPLAALNSLAVLTSSARDCGSRVAPCLPVKEAYPLADGQDYAHKTASLRLGGVGVSVGLGSSFFFEVDNHEVVTLLLSSGGRARVELDGAVYGNSPQQPGLFLPGEAYRCELADANGLVVTARPERLAAMALVMAEEVDAPTLDLAVLQQPLELGPLCGRSAHLLDLLRRTLSLLDGLQATARWPSQSQGLEDLLCRVIAGLLFPSLVRPGR